MRKFKIAELSSTKLSAIYGGDIGPKTLTIDDQTQDSRTDKDSLADYDKKSELGLVNF